MNRDIQSRRTLPHWYVPNAMHFITFRLFGTLPAEVIARLKQRKAALLNTTCPGESKSAHRARVHKQLFAEFDQFLDMNRGIHWLDDPRIAALVRRSLYFWNGQKYHLLCWCVMPNHVHVLLQPIGSESERLDMESNTVGESDDASSPLSRIMHSLKGYTAHEANGILGRSGSFWQHESYDHWVRDDNELERIVNYMNANPAAAGLCERPHQFPWSSAHDRFLHDGDTSGWLTPEAANQASTLARQLKTDG